MENKFEKFFKPEYSMMIKMLIDDRASEICTNEILKKDIETIIEFAKIVSGKEVK